jgi:hypothetical protein
LRVNADHSSFGSASGSSVRSVGHVDGVFSENRAAIAALRRPFNSAPPNGSSEPENRNIPLRLSVHMRSAVSRRCCSSRLTPSSFSRARRLGQRAGQFVRIQPAGNSLFDEFGSTALNCSACSLRTVRATFATASTCAPWSVPARNGSSSEPTAVRVATRSNTLLPDRIWR